jgi:hypothetical protein
MLRGGRCTLTLTLTLTLGACRRQPTPAIAAMSDCPHLDAVIASAADLLTLANCPTLRSLTIRPGADLALGELRMLTEVTRDVNIGPTVQLSEVSLPALVVIGGTLKVAMNPALGGIFVPALQRAGQIVVEKNASLTTISAPQLQSLRQLTIREHSLLATLLLPKLASVEVMLIAANPALELLLTAPTFQAQNQQITNSPKLLAR